MPTYQFSSITFAQSDGYDATHDDLAFDGISGATALSFSVSTSGDRYFVRGPSGPSVNFGPGAAGEVVTFADGSRLSFPSTSALSISGASGDDHFFGGPAGDKLNGFEGRDWLIGGLGNDTITGGAGQDTLDGRVSDYGTSETGSDIYQFSPGDSGVVEGAVDVIYEWSNDDALRFFAPINPAAYVEFVLTTYAEALDRANQQIGSGAADVVVVSTNSGLFVFVDTNADNGVADDAILLYGAGLGSISGANILTAPASSAPVPPATGTPVGPVPTTLIGGPGDDTLVVNAEGNFTLDGLGGNDRLFGGNGSDSLSGGDGDDRLAGGTGADTMSGGAGADIFSIAPTESNFTKIDVITDWSAQDKLIFVDGTVPLDGYQEATFSGYTAARNAADGEIGAGRTNIYVAAVGNDVYVFVDSRNDNHNADDVVKLSGARLDQIDASNFTQSAVVGGSLPPPPSTTTNGARVLVEGDMDLVHLGDLLPGLLVRADELVVQINGEHVSAAIGGTGFTYADNHLVGGTATTLNYLANIGDQGGLTLSVNNANFPAASVEGWIAADDSLGALATILAGSDQITGRAPSQLAGISGADLIRGFGGNDVIDGNGGSDTIFGGAGNDYIRVKAGVGSVGEPVGSTYLRGDEGDDYIVGGGGFDDINGNMGADTASGGGGDDWVVGGKDNDLLYGDAGDDLVYGNLGADTCQGGAGNDIIRGGKDNDILDGGAGDDFISGDKGDDTVSGGAGADRFHTFGDAGIDRVTDFNILDGDRVQLDPGTQYTVSQVGSDTVIDMVGGGKMILAGVSMSTLVGDWIFGA